MKKDGVLHMRLPAALKGALVDKAAGSGGYASVMRELIGAYLDGRITFKRHVQIDMQEEETSV